MIYNLQWTQHVIGNYAPTSLFFDYFDDYMMRSESMFQLSMKYIRDCPAQKLLIYCAGSRTARLLQRLLAVGKGRMVGLVDNNFNLYGKYLGPFFIESVDVIDYYPDATMIVSSFRSQRAIADTLRTSRQNPVFELYARSGE